MKTHTITIGTQEHVISLYDAVIHLAAAHFGERHRGVAAGAYVGHLGGNSPYF
jgi:hypothetical protein